MNFDEALLYYNDYEFRPYGRTREKTIKMLENSYESKRPIMDLIGGDSMPIPTVTELQRKKNTLKLLMQRIINYPKALEDLKRIYMLQDHELLENRLHHDFKLYDRTYQAGMKVSKLLGKIELDEKPGDANSFRKKRNIMNFEREIGSFANDPAGVSNFYLSVRPEDMFRAGIIGESCFSPEGENCHLPFILNKSKRWAVVHDIEWQARMYVLIDVERKLYLLQYSYPVSSTSMVYSADAYFQSLGFTRITHVNSHFGRMKYYLDASSNPYTELEEFGTNAKREVLTKEGLDALNEYRVFDSYDNNVCAVLGITGYGSLSLQYCEYCDRMTMPDNMKTDYMCEYCDEVYCSECGEYHEDCRCVGEEECD